MRASTCLAVPLLLLQACAHGMPQTESRALSCRGDGPAADILARFSEAAEAAVLPGLEPLADIVKLEEELGRLAVEHLGSHRDPLRRRADWILRCLPDARLPDLSDWERVGDAASLGEEARVFIAGPSGAGVLFSAVGWNPAEVASSLPAFVLARRLGPAGMGARSLLRLVVPARLSVVDRNLDRPVLAVSGAREVFVIHLSYHEQGWYLPTALDWYRRDRAPATPPEK